MSKPRKSPTLNAADLRLIREIVQQESLASNKAVRKEIAKLRKENMELRKGSDRIYQQGYNAGTRDEYHRLIIAPE